MSAATPEPQPLLLPAEAAKRLRCSEWWLKERARRGHIPHTRVGGGYKFTEEHIAQIIRLFEVLPNEAPVSVAVPRQRDHRSAGSDGAPVIQLKARTPRRSRTATGQAA